MKDNFNFNSNIKYITDNKVSSEANSVKQGKILNKDNFNKTFKAIENDLNLLYEKVRILQDCVKYSEMQLKNEISQMIDECTSTLKAIEEGRDVIKNNAYIKYCIPFLNSITESYVDRNSTPISPVSIVSGKLCTSNNKVNSFDPNIAEFKSKYKNNILENNIDTMIQEKSYRSFYVFNGIANNKVEEVITLKFSNPICMNYLNYTLSNCNVTGIEFRLIDDTVEKIKIDNIGKMKEKTVKEIRISILAVNYIVSQLDYNNLKGDFWDKIEEMKDDQNLYLDKDKYYYYLFGIDNIKAGYVNSFSESCYVSPEILVGEIKDKEYISLNEVSSIERGSIEYYIMDGTNAIPILNEDQNEIIDEKIFYKTPLRFPYDASKQIVIKKNGNIVSMPLDDAINYNGDDNMTVSYSPILSPIKISNKKIKVKSIIREYDSNYNTFISSISIKKYGGGALWMDKI